MPSKKADKLKAQKLQKRDTPRVASIDPEPAPGGSGKNDTRGR